MVRIDWLDYLFIAAALVSVLLGLMRGFVREILSLATWVAAFILALRFGQQASDWMAPAIGAVTVRKVLGYGLVFLVALLAGGLITWLIALLVRGSGLAPTDRMLGAGFGIVRGLFISAALVLVASYTPARESNAWKHSALVPQLQPLAGGMRSLIPKEWITHLESQPELQSIAGAGVKSEK